MNIISNNVSELTNTTTEITLTASTITTGVTENVYAFIDEYGNVTQIKKSSKERLKYNPDDINISIEPCVIGVSGNELFCENGIAMGCGDIESISETTYAQYNN